jgi:hypothetical protein
LKAFDRKKISYIRQTHVIIIYLVASTNSEISRKDWDTPDTIFKQRLLDREVEVFKSQVNTF